MATRPAAKKVAGPPPAAGEQFVYVTPNGKSISLPPMGGALSMGELRRLRGKTPLEIIFHILERENTEDEMVDIDEALDSMDLEHDMPKLVEAYQEFSRVAVGESSAS